MSQHVKIKRQANFKDFKRFEAFKGLVEQKNIVFNLFVCKLGSDDSQLCFFKYIAWYIFSFRFRKRLFF
jgi:hypothetical protein